MKQKKMRGQTFLGVAARAVHIFMLPRSPHTSTMFRHWMHRDYDSSSSDSSDSSDEEMDANSVYSFDSESSDDSSNDSDEDGR